MGNESMAGLRLASAAASMALAAAGVYVATSGGQATEPLLIEQDQDTVASVSASIQRTMLSAQVVATARPGRPGSSALHQALEQGAGSADSAADADGPPTRRPDGDAEEPAEGRSAESPGSDLALEEAPAHTAAEPKQRGPKALAWDPNQPVSAAAFTERRNRGSAANVAARSIAAAESAKEAQRLLGGVGAGLAFLPPAGRPTEKPVKSPGPAGRPDAERLASPLEAVDPAEDLAQKLARLDRQRTGSGEEPTAPRAVGSDSIDIESRRLLFVWDSSIVLDEAQSAELLTFAKHRGFDTLAVEATGVGYGDALLTDAFARFTASASALGIETFALIGYPWFTVSANAGLPGQPTSSLEGVAVLEAIAQTGLFDGVVDDSHPYGVTYDVDGESRNWLFDEPVAAGLDLQSWLRSAKAALGDLPLIKTTPFWYDSHPALLDVVSLEGEGFLTLGHLVASEVDAMAVLAYRDELGGPNGILQLVAGEMSMGPSIITLETGALGEGLDFLTFGEEGLIALEEASDKVVQHLSGEWAFAGIGVHHYAPIKGLATDLAEAQSFGFIGADSVTVEFGALVDAYDSSLGTYTDQMVYTAELDAMTGIGSGALVSNGDIQLAGGALVHGDARAGQGKQVNAAESTRITGEALAISTPLSLPELVLPPLPTRLRAASLRSNRRAVITGDRSMSGLFMGSYSSITIEGPATVTIRDLRMSEGSYIWADTTGGPVTLVITDSLDLGYATFIAPMSLQSRDLRIEYASSETIEMSESARLLADIVAPDAALVLNNNAEVYGRAIARSLALRTGARLHLDVDLLR